MVLTDVLTEHSHQVLHVSFSHSGKLFCTTSKDGYAIVSTFAAMQSTTPYLVNTFKNCLHINSI